MYEKFTGFELSVFNFGGYLLVLEWELAEEASLDGALFLLLTKEWVLGTERG